MVMADIVTGLIGIVLMVGFLLLILARIADPSIWVVSVFSIALMLLAFWREAVMPFQRRRRA
jgi:nitrate reductase gamma subunit